MIFIPPLRVRRFTVDMRELTIGQSLRLAKIPDHLDEYATTQFLRFATVDPSLDPLLWTVAERIMGVAHYLSAVSDEGADFSVGTSGARFSDYFMPEAEAFKAQSEPFSAVGDTWRAIHVTGRMVESLERLTDEIEGISGREFWTLGALAASLLREGESLPADDAPSDDVDAWLLQRLHVFINFPESDMLSMLVQAREHQARIQHIFKVAHDEGGLIVLPKEEVAGLPPARFPVRSTLSLWAQGMAGKPQRTGL